MKVSFTHLILLKKSPWFIYSSSEADALETINKFPPSEVVGVAIAKGDQLEVMTPETRLLLKPMEIKEIEHIQKPVDEEVLAKVIDGEKSDEASEQRKLPEVPGDNQPLSKF